MSDSDGYYWITGRVDDVINVSGHRMGTAEVESALVAHKDVSEAAVVGFPHQIKGQGIYAYVTLMTGTEPSAELRKELVAWVRKEIGPIAAPDVIQFAPGLPKTRSGKIMRRLLRDIADNRNEFVADVPIHDHLGIERGRPIFQIRRAIPALAGGPDIDETGVKNGVVRGHIVGHKIVDEARVQRAQFVHRLGRWMITLGKLHFHLLYFCQNASLRAFSAVALSAG